MNEITNTLNQLASLTSAVEAQVKELQEAGSAYADEAAHAKKHGDKVAQFSGSESQKLADSLTLRLKAAGNQIQFTGSQLIRFG